MGILSFPKKYRITRTNDYRRLYRDGRRVRSAHFQLFHLPSATGFSRIGLSSSRKVGKAAVRNLVKRRMREILRRQRSEFRFSADLVLVAHPSAALLSYREMETEILKMLKNAGLL